MSATSPSAPDPSALHRARRPTRLPFSRPVVWYPTLGLLALEEIVELPIVTAVVLGRLLVSGGRRHPPTSGGPPLAPPGQSGRIG